MPTSFPAPVKTSLLAAVLLPIAGAAGAQALPPGVQFGMSAQALQAALPMVERVARPQRLAGGLAGQWRAPSQPVAGLPFQWTFFFASGTLERVEYTAQAQGVPDLGAAAFAELVSWGRSQFGRELASSDPGSAYAAWVQGDTDIYAQHTVDPRRASVRLVYKARQLKDGSAL